MELGTSTVVDAERNIALFCIWIARYRMMLMPGREGQDHLYSLAYVFSIAAKVASEPRDLELLPDTVEQEKEAGGVIKLIPTLGL